MKIFNKKQTYDKRKILRKDQTDAEIKLWDCLKNKQVYALKFFRQYGIASYIADFYCPKVKLAIEVDGEGHFEEDVKQYDKIREELFTSLGIKTLRFTNTEVLNELNSVLERIEQELPVKVSSNSKWNNTPPSLPKRGAGGRSGVALITVVIIMLTMALIGASLMELSASVSFSAQTVLDETKARYLAEAGIAYSINLLRQHAGSMNAMAREIPPVNLGDGHFIVNFDINQFLITSTGVVNGVKKTLQLQYNIV